MMLTIFHATGLVIFALMALVGYRVARGPRVMDRIVAVNMVGTKTTVLLVVIGFMFQREDMFVDFALTYALLNFIGSLAAAKFFHKNRKVDLTDEKIGPPKELIS